MSEPMGALGLRTALRGPTAEAPRAERLLRGMLLVGLYAGLIVAWTLFLDFGRMSFDREDWIWEWGYDRVIHQGLTSATLPLHTAPPAAYETDRFLAVPTVSLAPQLVLLAWLGPGPMFLVTTLLFLSIGYLGCLALSRHLRLGLLSHTLLTVLVCLGGFITSHIGIGHTMFIGYFLLPWFVYGVLRLDGSALGRRHARLLCVVLFALVLSGAIHMYVWCLLFLAVLAALDAQRRRLLVTTLLWGVVVAAFRTVPAYLALATHYQRPFLVGYSTVAEMLTALVQLVPPASSFAVRPTGGWWEFDMYVGVVGLAALVLGGVMLAARRAARAGAVWSRGLALTCLVFAALAVGRVYEPVWRLPIPGATLVHAPSRFLLLPLLFCAVAAAEALQRWLDQRQLGWVEVVAGGALLVVLVHDLLAHAWAWRVREIAHAFPAVDLPAALQLVGRPDTVYAAVLGLSWTASLVALGLTLAAWRRAAR